MIFVQAILWGFAGGVAALLVGTVAGSILASILGIPPREGGPGFFALGIGLVASPLGFLGTVLFVLRSRGISFARIGIGSIAILATFYIAAMMLHWRNSHPQRLVIQRDYSMPLKFEILLPAGAKPAEGSPGFAASLQDGDGRTANAKWAEDQQQELDGRAVLSGEVRIYGLISKHTFALQIPDGRQCHFDLELPTFPFSNQTRDWSTWFAADQDCRIRYRVEP